MADEPDFDPLIPNLFSVCRALFDLGGRQRSKERSIETQNAGWLVGDVAFARIFGALRWICSEKLRMKS